MPGVYIKIGDVLRCYCNTALAKRTNEHTFQFMKPRNGKNSITEITYRDGSIGCPECGYKYTCIGITDFIDVNDEVITS